jgi:hypothetical protein
LNSRTSPYTPFVRRFTDERACDIAETVTLYRRVTAAHRRTVWAQNDAIERVSNHIVGRITEVVELPEYLPLGKAFDTFQRQMLALETPIFSSPNADFSKSLTLKEQVDLNRFLRAQDYFLQHADRISDQLVTAIGNVSAGLLQALPPLSDSAFTVPLISMLPNPHQVVDSIIGTLCTPELGDLGLFSVVQDRIYANICSFSGVPPDGSSKKPLIAASDADQLSPKELIDTYLANTPFQTLLLTAVPFALPDEQRFAGHWIIAPSGRGKTTLLHAMFLDDLARDASIIVMDSKGELINPIKNLASIRDRLVFIEPSETWPIALNPFDVPQSQAIHTVALIQYIMAGLLAAKFTALQANLFQNVVPAIIAAIPVPTLDAFRTVMKLGIDQQYLPRLDARAQEFFRDKDSGFYSDTYRGTRREIVWRLDYLMSNPIFRAMFTATHTKLDLAKEMDAGKIIIINNSKALLSDQGAEFLARFFVALILHAAQQRASRSPDNKLPCYVYIDECHTVVRRDENITTILDECRSQKIALILSHQRTGQLEPEVRDAVSNCAIRMANSDDEAKYLSDKLRLDADVLRSLPKGTFATFVRDLTSSGILLKIPYTDFGKLPKMSVTDWTAVMDRMRAQFSHSPQSQTAKPYASPQPEGAKRTRSKRKSVSSESPAEPSADHAEPAPKWGK